MTNCILLRSLKLTRSSSTLKYKFEKIFGKVSFVSLWFEYAMYFDQLLGAVGVLKLVEILAFSVFRRL